MSLWASSFSGLDPLVPAATPVYFRFFERFVCVFVFANYTAAMEVVCCAVPTKAVFERGSESLWRVFLRLSRENEGYPPLRCNLGLCCTTRQ